MQTKAKKVSPKVARRGSQPATADLGGAAGHPKLGSPLKLPDALGFELASAIEQQIIYLETVRRCAEGEGRYIRQAGGMGNFGCVKVRTRTVPYNVKFRYGPQRPESS